MEQLKGNVVCCNILPRKTKGYWSEFSHCKPDAGSLAAKQKKNGVKQQRLTKRMENANSLFIRGRQMIASSGGCWSWTDAATTQLSVLRKRVTQRHRRLREWETQRGKGFLPEYPAAKSSLKILNTRWLMHLKNAGEPKHSVQWWRVRGRDAWMRCRYYHWNCLNCCSLLFQGQTAGGWQSQFWFSHRSLTQAHSLDTIQGILGNQEMN